MIELFIIAEMPTSGYHNSGGIFLDQHPGPTRPNMPMQLPHGKFLFRFGPPTHLPHPTKQSVSDFNWLNTHPIKLLLKSE